MYFVVIVTPIDHTAAVRRLNVNGLKSNIFFSHHLFRNFQDASPVLKITQPFQKGTRPRPGRFCHPLMRWNICRQRKVIGGIRQRNDQEAPSQERSKSCRGNEAN